MELNSSRKVFAVPVANGGSTFLRGWSVSQLHVCVSVCVCEVWQAFLQRYCFTKRQKHFASGSRRFRRPQANQQTISKAGQGRRLQVRVHARPAGH